MVQLRDRRILIDEKPVLIFAGEIHYFRLDRKDWEDRIAKLKNLGCNAVASYIPWLVHEQTEGQFELRDVADFVDLCHHHGLWFIARPGPFIMAEVKNEGIPYWVTEKHPDAIPVSWNGEKVTSKNLDYLNEGFLKAVENWYGAIMPIIAARLQPKGGPVIGVQLDNEIGMLQWVTNQPDLSDDTLCDLAKWIVTHRPASRYPFDLNDPAARAKGLRSPTPEVGPKLLRDFGDYERNRFARYIATLRDFSEKNGARDIPFIVNIHGSGGGRGTQFPIGIHQLYETYTQAPGYLSGSDHYLGELTRDNAQDLYVINAFMNAVTLPGQPISSMEFEVGTGDYGETGGNRMSGAAADMKVRLSLAQGNRLLNYYLLAGGHNPLLHNPPADGNGRIGNNGERQGFAAPIDPEGKLDPTYFALQTTTKAVRAVADKLATMDEEHDDIALAFVPDYYKTDLHRPGPMRQIVENLESIRGSLETLTRALLFLGYRFPAIDIQNRPIDKPNLAFASSRYLDPAIQHKLVDYIHGGGHLLIHGELPILDMEGQPCTVLSDALGIRHRDYLQAEDRFYLSLQAQNEPEIRVWRAENYEATKADTFLTAVGSSASVGLETKLGNGKAVVLGCNYPMHEPFFRSLFARLGATAALQHGNPSLGVLLTSMSNPNGERFLTLINLDHERKELQITENGKPLFGRSIIKLEPRGTRLLPLNVRFGAKTIIHSTTELVGTQNDELSFRETGEEESILFA